jgi:ubiquinone/menaquinone biosynthesis C-methylase UbiE
MEPIISYLQDLEVILPVHYWENEFQNDWKNGKQPNRHFLNFLKEYHPQIGQKVLDIGSGDGRHLLLMAQLGYQCTGVELTESGIKTTTGKLQNYGLSAELVQTSFHNLPFEDASFHSIVSTQALHYNNWAGAKISFQEATRVLQPGGLFFFRARSDKGHWRSTDQQIPDEKGITRIETRGPEGFIVMVHDYTLEELQELAQENKLNIIDQPIDDDADGKPGQWNVVFQKK